MGDTIPVITNSIKNTNGKKAIIRKYLRQMTATLMQFSNPKNEGEAFR